MDNLGLCMTWTTLGHELKASRYYEQLKIVMNVKDSESWA